jgi:glycerol uptake facilitator-like aquaporin
MGAYAGILMTYLIFKRPNEGFFLWPHLQNAGPYFWYFSQLGNIYYGKVVFLEILNTLTFIWVYLIVIYKPSLRTVDEIIKGLAVAITLWMCYFLSAGSGACLNPALGLAQTTYQIGFLNTADQNGNGFASLIWVYMAMPLIGAIFAAIFFKINIFFDNRALKQGGSAQPVAVAPPGNVVR